MSKTKEYTSKAQTTQITATYRISTKIHDNFHTVEYSEQRCIPQTDDVDIEKEKGLLWVDVINEIENQIDAIIDSYRQ